MLSVASKRIVVATKTLRSQNAIFVTTRGVTDNMKLKVRVYVCMCLRVYVFASMYMCVVSKALIRAVLH